MNSPATYLRLLRIGWVLAREGVITAIPPENLPPMARLFQRAAGLLERRHAQFEVRPTACRARSGGLVRPM